MATGQSRGVRPKDRLAAAELLLKYWIGCPPKELPEPEEQAAGFTRTVTEHIHAPWLQQVAGELQHVVNEALSAAGEPSGTSGVLAPRAASPP